MTSIYLEDFSQRSKCPRLGTSEASEQSQYLQEVRPGGRKLDVLEGDFGTGGPSCFTL